MSVLPEQSELQAHPRGKEGRGPLPRRPNGTGATKLLFSPELTPSLVADMQAPRGQGGRADPIAGCLAQAFGIQNGGTRGVRRYCLAEVGWAVV